MTVCSPISTCAKNVIHLRGHVLHTGRTIVNVVSGGQNASCYFYLSSRQASGNYARVSVSTLRCPPVFSFGALRSCTSGSDFSKQKGNFQSLTIEDLIGAKSPSERHFSISSGCQNMNIRLSMSKRRMSSKTKGNGGHASWSQGCASTALMFSLLICYSSSEPTHAEAAMEKKNAGDDCDSSYTKFSHGKKVYTDYSITGIPGDGRCLFRSVAHGACLRAGKPAPSESLQRELADDLRARVADEFIKRRQETEWFVEGNFNTYVKQIRKPHVWGGEPELFMASHVLRMPITVYMYDEKAGGLISIAEYGHEYGKENPIRVLYHGFGHYDALQIPAVKGGKSKRY